jgi:predicted flap endonuclease-1-like 5' DNA nuclease
MSFVGGVLWWIVLGALVGWVAAWWVGRSSQRLLAEPVLQIVERRVDNPQHVARIVALESEVALVPALERQAATLPALQARIEELQSAPPRVVEKIVNRTVDRVIEKPVDRIVEKIVEKPVDRIVERVLERVVERVVPDAVALAERDAALGVQQRRVEHLEALAGVLAGRVVASASAPAAAQGAAAGVASAAPAVASTAAAAGADGAASAEPVRALRARIEHLEALAAVQAERLAEASARPQIGADLVDPAEIELVEGIGPKIAQVLRSRGFGSFDALAQASPGTLREILDDQGPAYRIADPSTWPEQARLAAQGSWDELKSLQDSLTADSRN